MIARRRSDRIFARALVLSLLLHVSAVTLFRIVFSFPHKDVEYFSVVIRETPPMPAADPAPPDRLSLAGPDFTGAAPADPPDLLPAIELPALKFEKLDQLRMRQEALETRSRYDEFFAGAAGDGPSGRESRFGSLGQTLSRLTFGPPEDRPAPPTPVSRPAPGFEAYIEWLSPPKDRKVLVVAPIDALWGLAPEALPEPLTLVFQVDRDGRVVGGFNVLSNANEIVRSAGDALGRYRFEPLLGDGPELQSGTFIVRAGSYAP